MKIAELPSRVIEAAQKAGLAESQTHLLAIAAEEAPKKQLQKIESICKAKVEKASKRKSKSKQLKGKKTATLA